MAVGAGVGGLVAEQHTILGGFAHDWTWTGREGDAESVFRFDSGVHDVSGNWPGGPVHGILSRLGLEDALDWKRLDHRFLLDGEPFDVPRGWDAYVDALVARMARASRRWRSATRSPPRRSSPAFSTRRRRASGRRAPATRARSRARRW